ncbi:restriction endonuclease subunit S [uncultured Tessaracoccus sp.]|uniref:restriction endonuclease subunit S n=1 Tax=uncultured Tessaracoccus sp. TaxID=905023 RepID=UPI0025F4C1E8|nr:restriction endonuclease subunit S [uncultured Tessaracoccus sp.]
MNHIERMLEELAPKGVEHLPLGAVGTFTRGNGLQKKDLRNEGVPAIHYGQIYTHYGVSARVTKDYVSQEVMSKATLARPGDVIIADTSENDEDLGRSVAWIGPQEVAVSNHTIIVTPVALDPVYLSYFMRSEGFQRQKRKLVFGTKVRSISLESAKKIEIPVPPFAVQQEIVRILDKFTRLEAELEAELEARRQQYSACLGLLFKSLPEGSFSWSTLGGVCTKVTSGGTPSSRRKEFYGGGIPWLRTQEVQFTRVSATRETISELGLENSSAHWIPQHCVIVAMYGATAAKAAINLIPLTTNQACCNLQVDPNVCDFEYVYYWITSQYPQLKSWGEGSQNNLNARKIKSFPIPVPSLGVQRTIAGELEKFDTLVSDMSVGLPAELAARRKQYEYYRDKLLTFKEKAA